MIQFITPSLPASTEVQQTYQRVRQQFLTEEIPHYAIYRSIDTTQITAQARAFSRDFEHIFILGTGGSRCGPEAFVTLHQRPFQKKKPPQIHFLSNVDPMLYHDLLQHAWNWEKVGVLVISKSGETLETLAQLGLLWPYIKTPHHIRILTEKPESSLGHFAHAHGIERFPHTSLGGRFSALTSTGLIPAALSGCDIQQIQKGALQTIEHELGLKNSHVSLGAPNNLIKNVTYLWHAYEKEIAIHVAFLYGQLRYLGLWYRQLWAESTGKDGKGITPVLAEGTEDQHSQLQLYQDGPRNKLYTFVSFATQPENIKASFPPHNVCHSFKEIFMHCATGSYQALKSSGNPCRWMILPKLNEESFGAFMGYMVLEVIMFSALLGVNVFDQPGVEKSKRLMQDMLITKQPSKIF